MFSAEEMGADQLTLMPDGRGFINVSSDSPRLSQFAGDTMIPLLYTGILDKSGKEICEGDIVQHDDPQFRWAIEWDFLELGQLESQPVLIIGNIYENPELLPHYESRTIIR